jgi:hypothetical protein
VSREKTAETEKARRFLDMHGDDMRRKYGIEGSAVGYKIKNGKYTDRIALIFYVKKKKSKEELLSECLSPIPREIDGITTDVVISRGFKPR